MHGPFMPKGNLCSNSGENSSMIRLVLEQDSDLLSSGINDGLFKTKTQRGKNRYVIYITCIYKNIFYRYVFIHYLFLFKDIIYPKK